MGSLPPLTPSPPLGEEVISDLEILAPQPVSAAALTSSEEVEQMVEDLADFKHSTPLPYTPF
jgi:hypothetical protein